MDKPIGSAPTSTTNGKSKKDPSDKTDTKSNIVPQKKPVTNDKKTPRTCSCIEGKRNCTNFKKKDEPSENESDKKGNSRKCMGNFCKKGALKSFCLEHNEKNHEMLKHCDCSHDEGFEAVRKPSNIRCVNY